MKALLIAGSGRSGTTWIADTLATCESCCQLFEPFNADRVPELPRWGRRCGLPGPYLRESEDNESWRQFLAGLLEGRVSNAWIRQDWRRVPERLVSHCRLAERIAYRTAMMRYRWRESRARTYVVKEIRANLMLPWMQRQFAMPLVFVFRHPCAVIGSRVRLSWAWAPDISELEAQPSLVTDVLAPFRDTIASANSVVEQWAVLWCVENLVPLRQAEGRDWLMCCYEDCVAESERMFARIFDFFKLAPTTSTRRAMRRRVSTPSRNMGEPRRWHDPLSEADGQRVMEICDGFGIQLYGRQTMPLCDPRETALKVV